jgi:hypothetical protein
LRIPAADVREPEPPPPGGYPALLLYTRPKMNVSMLYASAVCCRAGHARAAVTHLDEFRFFQGPVKDTSSKSWFSRHWQSNALEV